MEPVLTVTLNPALDLTTSVDGLEPRRKLRCERPRYDPGGGGVNVSRVMRELGGKSCAFVVCGGATGQQVQDLLERESIDTRVRAIPGETRTSFMVMDRSEQKQYRFILPGPEQTAEEADALLDDLADSVADGGFSFVVVSGSMLPGLPDDFCARLAVQLRQAKAKLILDTSGAALKAAVSEKPFLIKPNRQEAQSLVDQAGGSQASPEALADSLVEQEAAEVIVLTLGSDGAIVASDGTKLHIRPPSVKVRSTVGAGDSFVGALSLALARGWSLEEACRYGIAAATSAVTTEATALCEREATHRYFEEIAGNVQQLG